MAYDTGMADDERVTLYEMSEAVRHYEIAFGGAGLARLYVESFRDSKGAPQSTARLHFDGDVRPEIMRAVFDKVEREVLAGLPKGVCVVYRGHMVSSFDYGPGAPGSGGAISKGGDTPGGGAKA
jgi:hypothetical protein